jgi:hypothetical protein
LLVPNLLPGGKDTWVPFPVGYNGGKISGEFLLYQFPLKSLMAMWSKRPAGYEKSAVQLWDSRPRLSRHR